MGSWWRDKFIHRSKNVPILAKCQKVLSNVYSTALNGNINWPWSGATLSKARAWEAQILRLTFRACMFPHEGCVNYRIRTARSLRIKWKKMGLPLLTEKIVDNIWMTTNWAIYDGDVPTMKALRSILVWRTTAWWRSRSSWGMATDPTNVTRWRHLFGFHNRGTQWDTPMAKLAGEENDWVQLMARGPPRKEDVTISLLASMRQATKKRTEKGGGRADEEAKGPGPACT